jgi:lipid II:glycine glycyltransferase (peptidoglycan interpeptide bridge formation enzyme)
MDAISPYGYSSALFRGDRNWVSEAAKALVEVCRENNVVSAFIRLNPLIPIVAEVRTMIGTQVTHGTTIAVDLKLTREELGKQMRPSHRRDIVRLLRNNFIAAVDHWLAYDQFVAIYRETMDRLNANSYYRFSPDYFARLKTTLGDHLHIVSVCAPDGDLAAAGLFTEINGIVQYHLSGSSGAYGNLAPTKLMLDVAISWAKGENNHVLHLGGGVGGKEDDLFRFKSGFSKNKLPFETWRIITDASKYSELVTTSSGTAHETQAFFPEYRVPSLNEL